MDIGAAGGSAHCRANRKEDATLGRQQHRHHGDPKRFEVLAAFVATAYGVGVTYIADVAGGQGTLSRLLNKRYGYQSEVVDPREQALKGVPHRREPFSAQSADYYDLIVGLHPDGATRAIAQAALVRPAVLVGCFQTPRRSDCAVSVDNATVDLITGSRRIGIAEAIVEAPSLASRTESRME